MPEPHQGIGMVMSGRSSPRRLSARLMSKSSGSAAATALASRSSSKAKASRSKPPPELPTRYSIAPSGGSPVRACSELVKSSAVVQRMSPSLCSSGSGKRSCAEAGAVAPSSILNRSSSAWWKMARPLSPPIRRASRMPIAPITSSS